MRELFPERNAGINRQLKCERGEPLPQSEIDRINRQLRGEIANYAEEPEEEQTIESIIRQVLIDYSIGDLSDDIYANLDGYLRNKSGSIATESFIEEIRKMHDLDEEEVIYALFCDLEQTRDNENYIFTACVLEEGISFHAFNTSNNEETPAVWYMTWDDVKEVVFVENAELGEEPNAYIIAEDPAFEVLYETCDSQRLYLKDNTYMTIPCLYFGNYNVTDFLNKLISECEGFFYYEDSYQEEEENYSNPIESNDSYKNATYQEEMMSYKNNVSQNREPIDIGILSRSEQYFLEYLKSSSNTSVDESIASLYGISTERAQQLKQYFNNNLN